MRLIDADALYEKTAEWEAQALHMVEVTMNDEDKTEWKKWTSILNERSAFKFDIADAPTVEERKKGKWIEIPDEVFASTYKCSSCGEAPLCDGYSDYAFSPYCPNCGADMKGDSNG